LHFVILHTITDATSTNIVTKASKNSLKSVHNSLKNGQKTQVKKQVEL